MKALVVDHRTSTSSFKRLSILRMLRCSHSQSESSAERRPMSMENVSNVNADRWEHMWPNAAVNVKQTTSNKIKDVENTTHETGWMN